MKCWLTQQLCVKWILTLVMLNRISPTFANSIDPDHLEKPTGMDLHCLSLSIWICINNWTSSNLIGWQLEVGWHLNLITWQGLSISNNTATHGSGRVLWYHVGCPCVCLSYAHLYFHYRTITIKYQWIFTRVGMFIDIMEIWFGIANGQMSSIFSSPFVITLCLSSIVVRRQQLLR